MSVPHKKYVVAVTLSQGEPSYAVSDNVVQDNTPHPVAVLMLGVVNPVGYHVANINPSLRCTTPPFLQPTVGPCWPQHTS